MGFFFCRLVDGMTNPVQSSTATYARCPKTITPCPLCSPRCTVVLRYDMLMSLFPVQPQCVCKHVGLMNLIQGWSAYGYSCYWMEESVKTWTEAKTFCTEKDGVLLHIGDMWVRPNSQNTIVWCQRSWGGEPGSWMLCLAFYSYIFLQIVIMPIHLK